MSPSLALVITLVTTVGFALLAIAYARRRPPDLDDYIVSRDYTGTALSMATVSASVAGAWILFSPAEAATWSGIAGLTGYALGQAAPLAALAVIGPRMRRLMPNGHSLTDYTWHRYGKAMYALTIFLVLFYMFVFLAAEMTAISLTLQLLGDVPLLWTALIVGGGTAAYTCYGGLRASIFTDGIQFAMIVPMLVLVLGAALVVAGGVDGAFGEALAQRPELFTFDHRAGVAFGITLVIAILAANLFHQGYWQRVYACRDAGVVRRSYFASAVIAIPVVFGAGLFGLMAVGNDLAPGHASVALFDLARQTLPAWVLAALLLLALALVMSSMDTLLNGMASVITVDLARFRPGTRLGGLLRSSRVLTVLIAVPAVLVAAGGHSVLYLFLIADLACSAAVFPVFFGLYSDRISGGGAFVSAAAGLVAGLLFFPRPDFTPLFDLGPVAAPPDMQFLASFGAALGVSAAVAVAWNRVLALTAPARRFDFRRLAADVHRLGIEPRKVHADT